MDRGTLVTRTLAAAGTLFVWLTILFPIALSLNRFVSTGTLRIDYLMPGELFPLFALGSILLWVTARRSGLLQKSIPTFSLAAFAFLFAAQATAILTGMASGDREAAGWPWVVCNAFLILYILLVIFTGLLGISLIRSIPEQNP